MLGKAEKNELEALILERFRVHFDEHGAAALLVDGLRVVVDGRGVHLDHGDHVDPLAAVVVRTLFTALCYVPEDSPPLPREALEALATEATSAAASQINRLSTQ